MGVHRSRATARDQHVRSCITGVTIRSKRWLEVDGQFAIGEGGGELLRAIESKGSLVRAALHVGWSYRHAWGYVKEAESVLGLKLVSAKAGKGPTRGMRITREAQSVLAAIEDGTI
jgi:molybdate transport system regulatory protein